MNQSINKSNGLYYKSRKNLFVFFICILISSIVWSFIKLSKDYRYEIMFPLHFSQIPKDKVLVSNTDTILRVTVASTGYKLLVRELKNPDIAIDVNLSDVDLKKSGNIYETSLMTSNLSEKVLQNIDKLKLVSVYPSSINLVFEDAVTKKVPVKPLIDASFAKQFDYYGKVMVYPDSIYVKGAKKDIGNISEIETENLVFSDLSSTKFFTASLKKTKGLKEVLYSENYVKIVLPVAKYTEAKITLPLTFNSDGRKEKLLTFPSKVNVYYYVALKDYIKTDTSMFKVGVDFERALTGEVNKIKVDVIKSPPYVKILRIEPDRVEYIIQK